MYTKVTINQDTKLDSTRIYSPTTQAPSDVKTNCRTHRFNRIKNFPASPQLHGGICPGLRRLKRHLPLVAPAPARGGGGRSRPLLGHHPRGVFPPGGRLPPGPVLRRRAAARLLAQPTPHTAGLTIRYLPFPYDANFFVQQKHHKVADTGCRKIKTQFPATEQKVPSVRVACDRKIQEYNIPKRQAGG